MIKYKQLTEQQRYQLSTLKKAGILNIKITLIIKTSELTITSEIQRNSGKWGYRPRQAKIKADRRKQQVAKAIMIPTTVRLIEDCVIFI